MIADDKGNHIVSTPNTYDRFLLSTEKQLISNYAAVLTEIRVELLRLYEKYGKGGSMTYSDMAKYNRLSNLFKSVAGEITKISGKNRYMVNKLVEDIYSDVYYRNMYQFDKYTGFILDFGYVNNKAIQALIENPLKELAEKNVNADMLHRIKNSVTQGLIRGDSFVKIAQDLKGVMNTGLNRALRIARTEGMRALSQAQLDAYTEAEDDGIVGVKQWVSTHDIRTRDSHGYMDGKKANREGVFTLRGGIKTTAPHMTGYAAEDINCRCRMIYVIAGYEPSVRRERGTGVVSYQNYQEWYAKNIA